MQLRVQWLTQKMKINPQYSVESDQKGNTKDVSTQQGPQAQGERVCVC